MNTKIVVWSDPSVESPPIRLKLFPAKDGSFVDVRMVDAKGDQLSGGVLLRISPEGFYRLGSVNTRVGMALDSHDKIKELATWPPS